MQKKPLILQSHRQPLPHSWLEICLASVRNWATEKGYKYLFVGDELFDLVPTGLAEKFSDSPVIRSDLARLKLIKSALDDGFDCVVWLDADFLIFAPEDFVLPDIKSLREGYLLGREIWVQQQDSRPGKIVAHKKVHNAFLLFARGNTFLDFYISQAEKLLFQVGTDAAEQTSVPPQFIGPKLLTALHNVIQCPVLESAGVLSPEVVLDLLSKGERNCALQLMRKRSDVAISAANLCSSSVERGDLSSDQMHRLCRVLLEEKVSL